jgi:hypothetical protein
LETLAAVEELFTSVKVVEVFPVASVPEELMDSRLADTSLFTEGVLAYQY